MLVRAGRCRGHLDRTRSFNVACKQLQLPWLCPAYKKSQICSRRLFAVETGVSESSLRKRRDSQDGSHSPQRRSLATAVDIRPLQSSIPFEELGQNQLPPLFQVHNTKNSESSSSSSTSFDPTNTLVLKDGIFHKPQRIRYYKGIGGDLDDILLILDACLRVGRMERARAIMNRISSLGVLEPEAMIDLHNRYLKAAMDSIIERPSNGATQAVHKWFELEIRNKGLPISAETVGYMLKASLQSPPGSRRDRLVRRYMDMGGLEVLGLMGAEEQALITEIFPHYNYPVGEIDRSYDAMETEQPDTVIEDAVTNTSSDRDAVPMVRPVDLKGLGLKTLQQSLSMFTDKPAGFNAESLNSEQKRQRQTRLETDAIHAAIDRWRDENEQLTKMGVDTTLETKSLGSRMWKWQGVLEDHIREELVKVELAESKTNLRSLIDNDRCLYGPFLRILSPERLAAVTILTAMTTLSGTGASKGLQLASGVSALGASIEDECVTEAILKTHGKKVFEKLGFGKAGGVARMLKRKQHQAITDAVEKLASKGNPETRAKENIVGDPQWSASIKGRVGAFMMSALIETATIPVKRVHPETGEEVTQMQPAFSHAYQYKNGRRVGVILANPALIAALQREPVHGLLAKHLPMLSEPQPWTRFNDGGFLVHPAKVMRIKHGDKDQRNYAEAAINKGDMEQMFKGLDVLGRTPWKINKQVFDTMLEAWNTGIAIANFPPADPDLKTPPEPEASEDPSVRRDWVTAVKNVENIRGACHSQRCFQNFQLEIARALRDELFYFPHNIDFRGRAYPIPPYLNHMGADHCRGLLTFGKGKKLGPGGLKWLKIHLANVYGYDKASLHERETFTVNHLKDIFDSASDPLGGTRWWLTAEDPWQCLAACFEIKNALDCPDSTQFVSHLPIHQDGTCNGLQHYAALGGDEWGAKQVNLTPGDRPADVYSAVADLVKQSLAGDLERGNEYAKILDGKITRKVVKQTVMTNVYGVTFIGAKAQVRKQLEAAYPDLPNTVSMHPGLLASYIAKKIFKALSSMFSGAHDIQYWLGECANRISQVVTPEQIDLVQGHLSNRKPATKKENKKVAEFSIEDYLQFKSSVIWTNPLRMPVVQPYRNSKTRMICTNLQNINLSDPHSTDPVSKRKQLQGFPPNFVHSLDATHMILSALACDEKGLSFAAVHDSFWTHATDVEDMNGVLRDAFIRIHSEDVIGRLASEFEARYKGGLYLAKIKENSRLGTRLQEFRKTWKNSPEKKNLKAELKGINTHQAVKIRELLIERQRIQLLSSSDPTEVEAGLKMVTPGSIFEEMAAVEDLAPVEDLVGIELGAIPKSSESKSEGEARENFDLSNVDDTRHISTVDSEADAAFSVAESDVPNSESPLFAKILGTKAQKSVNWQWAWVPFSLPPVPKKGSFNVSQLKNSDYFFS